MLHDTPLRSRHEAWAREHRGPVVPASARPGAASGTHLGDAVEYLTYGPPDEGGLVQCEVPATFGSVELEYAAIRRGAGLFDAPHRGTIVLRGGERLEFLERMLTQKLADVVDGDVRTSFWLNRKGRIEADLRLFEHGNATWVDVDVHQAASTVKTLGAFLFTEDVALADESATTSRLVLHGPAAPGVLAAAGATAPDAGRAVATTIGGHDVLIARDDETGGPGMHLFVSRDAMGAVWDALLAAGTDLDVPVRPVGWYAYNIARLEAGTPLFNVDFGATNIPHESGLLAERVSFTKGCYLGQEVVARLESLGRPKQVLTGLVVKGDALPVAGSPVFARGGDGGLGEPLGVITSSTLSPMLGAVPVALAMLRNRDVEEGATVLVEAEGRNAEATITSRPFWRAES